MHMKRDSSKRVFGFNEFMRQLVTIRMHYRLQCLSADIDLQQDLVDVQCMIERVVEMWCKISDRNSDGTVQLQLAICKYGCNHGVCLYRLHHLKRNILTTGKMRQLVETYKFSCVFGEGRKGSLDLWLCRVYQKIWFY